MSLGKLLAPLRTPKGRIIVALLIITGGSSAVGGVLAAGASWLVLFQLGMLFVFVVGVALVLLPTPGRIRFLAALLPATGLIVIGVTLLPQFVWLLMGAAAGWFIAALVLFRQQASPEVHRAIRQMRRGNYDEAISEMDTIIKRDRENSDHYRLRAIIFQLDDRLDRALRDYQSAAEYANNDALRAEAYNGLAEVNLQREDYPAARKAALQAHELFTDNWVPLYNLGLIHDRLSEPEKTIEYLQQAIDNQIGDERQLLLTYLYMARAYQRMGEQEQARQQVSRLENMWKPLEELEKLIADEASVPLSRVIAADIELARALMIDDATVEDL